MVVLLFFISKFSRKKSKDNLKSFKKFSSDVGFEPTRQYFSHPRVIPRAFRLYGYIGRLRPLGQSDHRW